MRLSKREQVVWSLIAVVAIVVGTAGVVKGLRIRARTADRLTVFTILEMTPGPDGTIRVKWENAVVGDNLKSGLARKIGSEVFVYYETVKGSSGIREWLGFAPMIGDDSAGLGEMCCELGDCPASQMIKTPLRIELKPGERVVLATCRNKSGAKVELYVYCDI
jgi:hypothetical protein